MKFCVVGSGLSGCIIARHLAGHGHHVTLIESRSHIGGNCHSYRDPKTGIMLHAYGPHIFHTAYKDVWEFIQKFGYFYPFVNRVKAVYRHHVYSLPVNLMTINQFFNCALSPQEAKDFIKSKADKAIIAPKNFEEQALSMIGPQLYEAFFKGYTKKQWGLDPTQLPASILKRLPVRFNYDDNYFNHPYQGMPRDGYTALMQKMLKEYEEHIDVRLNTPFEQIDTTHYAHIFYTGPIDRYFEYALGRLDYRTLNFERIDYAKPDYQGNAVINYCDENVPYTRISEHKHFAPWEADKFPNSVCFAEYSSLAKAGDIPYYPVRLATQQKLLKSYEERAISSPKISFLGRLGTYRYLDMDVTIKEALEATKIIDKVLREGSENGKVLGKIPTFFHKSFLW